MNIFTNYFQSDCLRAELEIAHSIKSTTRVNPDLWVTVTPRLTLLTKITVYTFVNSRVIVCILRGFNRALLFRERMTPRYFAKTKHRDARITGAINFDYRSPLLFTMPFRTMAGRWYTRYTLRKSIIWFVKKETRALIRNIDADIGEYDCTKVERSFATLKRERVYS